MVKKNKKYNVLVGTARNCFGNMASGEYPSKKSAKNQASVK
jgi:hypothetical protein